MIAVSFPPEQKLILQWGPEKNKVGRVNLKPTRSGMPASMHDAATFHTRGFSSQRPDLDLHPMIGLVKYAAALKALANHLSWLRYGPKSWNCQYEDPNPIL